MDAEQSDRILVAAPTGRDAELICSQLGAAGMRAEKAENALAMANEINAGVGAIVLTEEALVPEGLTALSQALTRQPAWSEVPLILLTGETSLTSKSRVVEGLDGYTNARRRTRRRGLVRDLTWKVLRRLHPRAEWAIR